MAPAFKNSAKCICYEKELAGRTLQNVADEALIKEKSPSPYEVTVKKSKAAFKPTKKGGKKLNDFDFTKATDMYVDEKSNMVAFAVPNKKKSVCVAFQFNDAKAMKEFQSLARSSNKKLTNSVPAEKSTKEDDSDKTLEADSEHLSEAATISSNRDTPPRHHRSQPIDDDYTPSRRRSRRSSSPICPHCHQKIPNDSPSEEMEPKRLNTLPSRQSRPGEFREGGTKEDYVFYLGRNGYTSQPYPIPHKYRGALEYSKYRPADIWSDTVRRSTHRYSFDGSSVTSTTSAPDYTHSKEIGSVTCRTPTPRFKRTPLESESSEPKSRHRRSHSPALYVVWDPSSEELSESRDYYGDQSSSSYADDSVISYDDASSSSSSIRSKKIDKLIHELGKPRAIRLY